MVAQNMSTTTTRHTVVAVFDTSVATEQAIADLRDSGFAPDQVSVVAVDTSEARDIATRTDLGEGAATGTGTGAMLGGLTGGVLGWLVGIGALTIPGIGPIVAGGALATTLGGAAIGAAAGGLIGVLVDLGVPEDEARTYEESVRQGRILLTLTATSERRADQARQILSQHTSFDVGVYGDDTTLNYSARRPAP